MSASLWGVQGQSEPQQLRSAQTDACGSGELAVCRETLPKKRSSAAAGPLMPLAAAGLMGALAGGAGVAAVTASSACPCRRGSGSGSRCCGSGVAAGTREELGRSSVGRTRARAPPSISPSLSLFLPPRAVGSHPQGAAWSGLWSPGTV